MCFNFVGGATHSKEYKGPTIPDAADLLTKQLKGHFGGVTIAERHEKKGNEHETLLKKQSLGAEWFITQAIYDQEPTIKLINDYGKLCKERNVKPVKIILTFAPCGREKTMKFIKWLGVKVPEWVEQRIFSEDATPAKMPLNKSPVERSVDILCDMCEDILEQTKDSGVPLGVSVESVSIFKNEVEAAHELFRRCQHIALDFFKRPWRVNVELIDVNDRKTNDAKKKTTSTKTGGDSMGINPLTTALCSHPWFSPRSFDQTVTVYRERERERERERKEYIAVAVAGKEDARLRRVVMMTIITILHVYFHPTNEKPRRQYVVVVVVVVVVAASFLHFFYDVSVYARIYIKIFVTFLSHHRLKQCHRSSVWRSLRIGP